MSNEERLELEDDLCETSAEIEASNEEDINQQFCFHNDTAWICPDCGLEVKIPDEGDGRSSCKACRALVCPQEMCTQCDKELGEIK